MNSRDPGNPTMAEVKAEIDNQALDRLSESERQYVELVRRTQTAIEKRLIDVIDRLAPRPGSAPSAPPEKPLRVSLAERLSAAIKPSP